MSLLLSILLVSHVAPPATEPTTAEVAAAPAIDESVLAPPTVLEHEHAVERGLIDAVRAVLDTQLSAGDRRRLGRKVLSASRVTIVEGTFPASGAILVTVNVELRRPDPAAAPLVVSGAFTVDASGTLATIVVAPEMRPQRHELELAGDVDGDGLLDVVLREVEGDTETRRLVTWTGGNPSMRVLPPAEHEGC